MSTHLKRFWGWERLRAKGKGRSRGWTGKIASSTQWTWIWANSGREWRTGKPSVLQFMGSQRVGCELVTEKQQIHSIAPCQTSLIISKISFYSWFLRVWAHITQGCDGSLEFSSRLVPLLWPAWLTYRKHICFSAECFHILTLSSCFHVASFNFLLYFLHFM